MLCTLAGNQWGHWIVKENWQIGLNTSVTHESICAMANMVPSQECGLFVPTDQGLGPWGEGYEDCGAGFAWSDWSCYEQNWNTMYWKAWCEDTNHYTGPGDSYSVGYGTQECPVGTQCNCSGTYSWMSNSGITVIQNVNSFVFAACCSHGR